MKRITSDNTFEMNMYQLALNQVCIKDGWAWYRNAPEDELSVCDLIRRAAEALSVDLPMLNDDDLSDLMVDWLQYGAEEPEGVLAVLYRALWAMATVRAKLAAYEDAGLEPEDATDLMAAHGTAIEKLAEYRMREEKKAPRCYSPDIGGECRYLVPDGDDEPIDRCKKCPLCCADKQRHRSEPNDPLTLEELREMDGEPVWIKRCRSDSPENGEWGLVFVGGGFCRTSVGNVAFFSLYGIGWTAYCRRLEEVVP